MAKGFAGF